MGPLASRGRRSPPWPSTPEARRSRSRCAGRGVVVVCAVCAQRVEMGACCLRSKAEALQPARLSRQLCETSSQEAPAAAAVVEEAEAKLEEAHLDAQQPQSEAALAKPDETPQTEDGANAVAADEPTKAAAAPRGAVSPVPRVAGLASRRASASSPTRQPSLTGASLSRQASGAGAAALKGAARPAGAPASPFAAAAAKRAGSIERLPGGGSILDAPAARRPSLGQAARVPVSEPHPGAALERKASPGAPGLPPMKRTGSGTFIARAPANSIRTQSGKMAGLFGEPPALPPKRARTASPKPPSGALKAPAAPAAAAAPAEPAAPAAEQPSAADQVEVAGEAHEEEEFHPASEVAAAEPAPAAEKSEAYCECEAAEAEVESEADAALAAAVDILRQLEVEEATQAAA